jgi:hypothetical protein
MSEGAGGFNPPEMRANKRGLQARAFVTFTEIWSKYNCSIGKVYSGFYLPFTEQEPRETIVCPRQKSSGFT